MKNTSINQKRSVKLQTAVFMTLIIQPGRGELTATMVLGFRQCDVLSAAAALGRCYARCAFSPYSQDSGELGELTHMFFGFF